MNSIHPGFIDTPLTQAQDTAINAHVIGLTPMKRAGTARIANGYLFLAEGQWLAFYAWSEIGEHGRSRCQHSRPAACEIRMLMKTAAPASPQAPPIDTVRE